MKNPFERLTAFSKFSLPNQTQVNDISELVGKFSKISAEKQKEEVRDRS